MQDFRNLEVWERAFRLTLAVYRATVRFPPEERYGLTSQMRRAAAFIAANIAEGCGRDGDAELCRFLQIAMGSASELEFHLLLAAELGYAAAPELDTMQAETVRCKRMLAALIVKLRRPRRTDRPRDRETDRPTERPTDR
ncbi:MAG: four helix bundle protein [Terriglobales bacterium]